MGRIFELTIFIFWLTFSPVAFTGHQTSYPITISSNKEGAKTEVECSNIDLLKNQNLSLWTTFRHQTPSSWCGAYSLADGLSYITQSSISAIQIGATYWQNLVTTKYKADFDPGSSIGARLGYLGGAACEILGWVQKNGTCSSENLDDADTFLLAKIIHSAQNSENIAL